MTTISITLISTTACKNGSSMIENQARKWTQSLRYCTTSFIVDIHNGYGFKHVYLLAMLKSDLDDRSFLYILNDKITFYKNIRLRITQFNFLHNNSLSIIKAFPFDMSCEWPTHENRLFLRCVNFSLLLNLSLSNQQYIRSTESKD